MPGSALPIFPIAALIDNNIKFCLIGVNPNIENIILETNAPFIEAGGTFLSIYNNSELSINKASFINLDQ